MVKILFKNLLSASRSVSPRKIQSVLVSHTPKAPPEYFVKFINNFFSYPADRQTDKCRIKLTVLGGAGGKESNVIILQSKCARG